MQTEQIKNLRRAEWIALACLGVLGLVCAISDKGRLLSTALHILIALYFFPVRLLLFRKQLENSFILTSILISFTIVFNCLACFVTLQNYWISIPNSLLTIANLVLFIIYIKKGNPDFTLHLIAWLLFGAAMFV